MSSAQKPAIIKANPLVSNWLKRLYVTSSNSVKLQALTEISQQCWSNGDSVINYLIHDKRFMKIVMQSLGKKAEEGRGGYVLKLQALQMIALLARSSSAAQEIFITTHNIVALLLELLSTADSTELKQWTTHALFWISLKQHDALQTISAYPDIQETLTVISQENWNFWLHNDAKNLKQMMDIIKP